MGLGIKREMTGDILVRKDGADIIVMREMAQFIQTHMEKAFEVLVNSRYDEVVELIDKDEFIADPLDAYENKIFCKGAPLKTAVIWNKNYIEEDK